MLHMASKPMLWNKARRDLYAITMGRSSACNHRQVEPGLRCKPLQSAHLQCPFCNLQSPRVGHVTHGIPADALEQSEA